MPETKAIIYSHLLDTQNGSTPADPTITPPDDRRLVWIHLNGHHADTKKYLRDVIGMDAHIMKSMLAEETRPRIEEVDGHVLMILRGINFNPGPTPEDLVSVRLWMSDRRIVSVGRRKSKALAEMDERLRQNRGPRAAGEFVATLCAILNDGIEPALQEIENATDKMEDIPLDNRPDAGLRASLSDLRMQATQFRRHMSPQRDVVKRLQQVTHPPFTPADKWSVQDSYDRITRFIEDLDALSSRTQILQDELAGALSARLNRNLYVLSFITVLFMPLTFITGLLGMNVAGIPHAENPWAFAIVCGIALCMLAGQLLVFRWLRWF